MKSNRYTIEQLKEAVKTSINFAETLRKLGIMQYSGNNRKTLKKYIIEHDIDISHFLGCGSGKGKKSPKKLEFPKHPTRLKSRLIENGTKENKCEECNITEWRGKPLVLEMHHLDGNRFNNRLENLQLLCPNCHSQTDNFRYKNKKV